MSKPLCVELFCGMFGWGEGFVSEGYRVVGFDIEHLPHHGSVPEGCSLALQDVLTLHGSQFKDAAVIVASPPCQAYSYRAMPWKRAKALPPPSNELFDACFRIQQEASEAAGRYIPLVVENVKGAQPWVGRAAWHYGSFYLWGDVPALMPIARALKVPGFNFHQFGKTGKSGGSFQSAAVDGTKIGGQSWSNFAKTGEVSQHWRMQAANGTKVAGQINGREYAMTRGPEDGIKTSGGDAWFDKGASEHSSRSSGRKAASAAIAKIPLPLARHIAQVYKP